MDFCRTFHKVPPQQSSITEMKSTFIQLQNAPLPKAIDQKLPVVKNIVCHVPFPRDLD